MFNIALLFAHWRDFGEKFCVPENWEFELKLRGHTVDVYNLYHGRGQINFRDNIRHYSSEEFNNLASLVRDGHKQYDIIFVLDYGPWQNLNLNKNTFPNSILVKECGDEIQAFPYHVTTAHLFDIVLSPDKRCVINYNTRGINAHFQPHFADKRWFFPRPEIPIQYDAVTTTGSRGNGITEKLKEVLGEKFENSRFYYGHDYGIQLSKGKMVWHKSQHGEIGRRIFEGMAVSRMVITDRLDSHTGLQELFQEGEDIIFYDNAEDCIEKIRYYAGHDEERERIALNGYNKVMANHTIKSRVDHLEQLIKDFKS